LLALVEIQSRRGSPHCEPHQAPGGPGSVKDGREPSAEGV